MTRHVALALFLVACESRAGAAIDAGTDARDAAVDAPPDLDADCLRFCERWMTLGCGFENNLTSQCGIDPCDCPTLCDTLFALCPDARTGAYIECAAPLPDLMFCGAGDTVCAVERVALQTCLTADGGM